MFQIISVEKAELLSQLKSLSPEEVSLTFPFVSDYNILQESEKCFIDCCLEEIEVNELEVYLVMFMSIILSRGGRSSLLLPNQCTNMPNRLTQVSHFVYASCHMFCNSDGDV